MIKLLIKLIAICFLSIILSLLYYFFFSYSKYNGRPAYFPSPVYPMFIVMTFACGMVYAKYLIKLKLYPAFGVSIILVILFILTSNYIDNKYGYILQHYYQGRPYTNLLNLPQYTKEKGNYITVIHKLREEGFEINHLYQGSTDSFNPRTTEDEPSYTKRIYFVNDKFYIIFDWETKGITNKVEKEKLKNSF